MKKIILVLFLMLSNSIFSQKNEVAIQSNISNIGLSYEYFTNKHFSFGLGGGIGTFAVKKDEVAIMTSSNYYSKNYTKFYFSPFARYYFKDNFEAWFLMMQFYSSSVKSTIYTDDVKSNEFSKKYFGPLIGGGYKFNLKNNFTFNLFLTLGYDFNDNDLVPVMMDGFFSVGYRF